MQRLSWHTDRGQNVGDHKGVGIEGQYWAPNIGVGLLLNQARSAE